MKKLLSAVLMMMTIIAAATLTSSVLAADPYEYIPEDGLPVVYYSSTGTVNASVPNAVEKTSLADAASAIKGSGYIVLLEDVDIGRAVSIPGASGNDIITYVGRDDLDSKVSIKARHMCGGSGNIKFENLNLHWYKVDSSDNDQSLRMGTKKLILGENVEVTGDGIMFTGANMEFYSGSNYGVRLGEWGQKATYGSVNIVVGGNATLDYISATHANPASTTTIGGDFNIIIKDNGTFGGTMNNPGKTTVAGNYNVIISGGKLSNKLATFPNFTVDGLSIINALDYPAGADKNAVISKIDKSKFDVVMVDAVYVSDDGDDTASGAKDAPVATYAKAVELLGSAGGVVVIDGTATLSGTEAARTANIIVTGGTAVVDGDFVLGGSLVFTSVNIKNGAEGTIVAGGKSLNIMADVTTEAGKDGNFIDVVAGKLDELVVCNVNISAGTYNNIIATGLAGSTVKVESGVKVKGIGVSNDVVLNALSITKSKSVVNAVLSLSEFVDAQAAKVVYSATENAASTEAAIALTTGSSAVNGDTMPFARVEYYFAGESDSFIPAIVVGETVYTANEASKKGWNVASFDMTGAGEFQEFTFLPFGELSALDALDKLYINTITFSHFKNTAGVTYEEPLLSSKNDYIPTLEDYVMTVDELVNTSNLKNIIVEETPFVAGAATKYTPEAATNVCADYYTLQDGGIIKLNGEFQPYVRIEYFMYAREGEEFTGNPTIVIDENEYVASQPLVANKWAVATFNIKDYSDDFNAFKLYPYGNAEGLNEWNKLYVQQIIFSQTENTEVKEYPVPEMTEDGEVVPYIFDPAAEGLQLLPVVYYANGGVYTGAAKGSVSSLYAYGSLTDAIDALENVGGGYLILTSDIKIKSGTADLTPEIPTTVESIKSHKNMIIFRGMEKEDEKINLYIAGQPRSYGPISFQNINYVGATSGDTGLNLSGYEFGYGTPGGDDNDVTQHKAVEGASIPFLVLGGDGYTTNHNIKATFYSGTYTGGLRTTFGYNKYTLNGGVELIFKGGNYTEMTVKNGHVNMSTVKGNYTVRIEGGKWKNSMNFADCAHVAGGFTLIISGNPDFTQATGAKITAPKAADATQKGFAGTRMVDILGYEGDFEALKKIINLTDFDILNVNSIYVTNGGTGDGSSKDSPLGSFAAAIAACTKQLEDGRVEGGRVVVCGEGYTVTGNVTELEGNNTHTNSILYTSVDNAPLTFESGNFILCGPARFTNITLKAGNADGGALVANGYALELSETVKGEAYEGKYVDIVMGNLDETVASTNVTINGGTYGDVITGGSVEGDVNVVFNGGKVVGSVVGGSSAEGGVIGGSVTIVINDGEFAGKIIGGNNATDAVIEGTVYLDINGGKFTKDCTILATNENATATVEGNAEVNISGGDFSAMEAGQIQPGSGICGDKVCVDYETFVGDTAAVRKAVSSTFDVIIEPKADAPVFTESDRFIFIIQHIGDPTKALTKSIPFKITQSVKQTSAPIVVSPKQLNIKMDGSDHAIMSLQTVKDTVDTIRYVPNANPTKGTSIVSDGYNINGRGVDVSKYKYIEIVYYYTVPEGETAAVKNMTFRPLSDHSKCAMGNSEELVPNKWTTTLIDMTDSFAGATGNLKQYHFHPMGFGKKNTDVPTTQYLDIASLTFYTDKPNTVIQGGNAPSMKAVQEEAVKPAVPAAPQKIEDIVVNVVNLKSTVDNSGSFTSAQVVKDGSTVMEYTPNISSDKDLRIEGYNCMGKAISLNDYQYLTMKVMIETKRTDVTFKTQVINCNGGVADNPEKAKLVTWTADTALVPNEWTTVTLKIAPTDPAFHITRQFHIAPIGNIKGNTMQAGEKFYLAEFVLSNKPPKSAAAADGEEVVEVEQEVIAESPAIVVDGAKLINSAGNFPTFKSTVGEFDGKKVVMVKPNSVAAPVSIDGAAIFGKTEQTPESALNLKTHRYAIISYYYASASEAERIPEFDLLGGRIQDKIGVVNGITAKGTEGLKRNEWATVVVKLSGNGAGSLASGFNLKPFGDVAADKLDTGDVLYIENITFVSNRP